ncbi:hypothetical protein WJR50_17920 [Catalinimonas sp. 4WD22]|uniref:hypothetical protein n=1 Tax=Catalinimonas locisalis TaxID=3133978 RepID=UPI0031017F7C
MRFILIVFFFFSTLILSCQKEETCGKALPYFEIQALQAYNLVFTNDGLNPWEVITDGKSVDWQNYFIRVGFEMTYTANTVKGGASLYALDCLENGYQGSLIGLDTLFVIAQSRYNQEYAAGDTLNHIILLSDWTLDVEDFNQNISLNEYLAINADGVREMNFEIKFTEAPQAEINQFEIIYKLENGDEFKTCTEAVELR